MWKKIFKYIEPAWCGNDNKFSKTSALAIVFSINFLQNISFAVRKWDSGKSLEGLALVLSVEAGLIVTLLGIKAWRNSVSDKLFSNQQKIEEVTE